MIERSRRMRRRASKSEARKRAYSKEQSIERQSSRAG